MCAPIFAVHAAMLFSGCPSNPPPSRRHRRGAFRFTVNDGPGLNAAIISALMASSACVFSLTEPGAFAPDAIIVTADGASVPADPENAFGCAHQGGVCLGEASGLAPSGGQ